MIHVLFSKNTLLASYFTFLMLKTESDNSFNTLSKETRGRKTKQKIYEIWERERERERGGGGGGVGGGRDRERVWGSTYCGYIFRGKFVGCVWDEEAGFTHGSITHNHTLYRLHPGVNTSPLALSCTTIPHAWLVQWLHLGVNTTPHFTVCTWCQHTQPHALVSASWCRHTPHSSLSCTT